MSKLHLSKPPIGKLEMQILEYLADHKDSLVKPIQEALGKEYSPVYLAVQSLCKKTLLAEGKKIVVRGSEHSSYKLSFSGVAFVLTYGKEPVLLQVIANYEEVIQKMSSGAYLQLEQKLSQKVMLKFMRLVGSSVLQLGEGAWNVSMQMVYLLNTQLSNHIFSASEWREISRAVRSVPETKAEVLRIKDRINAWESGTLEDES